jgi:hypothetical protein
MDAYCGEPGKELYRLKEQRKVMQTGIDGNYTLAAPMAIIYL